MICRGALASARLKQLRGEGGAGGRAADPDPDSDPSLEELRHGSDFSDGS